MSTRCDLTELLTDQCACRQHRGGEVISLDRHTPTEIERTSVSRTFPASYPGRCVCGTKWRVGDLIAYNSEDELVGLQCCTGDI